MKKDVVAYPLSSNNTIIAQYNDLLKDINIVGFISGELYNIYQDNSDIPVYDDIHNGLSKADTLLILPLSDTAQKNRILQQIFLAIYNKKNIFSLHKFNSDMSTQIIRKCKERNVKYKQLANQEPPKYINLENRIWDMSTPLVVCGGLSECCGLPHIELELRRRFLNDGYRVSQISSFDYAHAFGYHSLPSLLYSNTLCEVDKTLYFNRYIKEIETLEQPEIFIIGIPKSLCALSDKYHLGFGNIPFLMSHAFTSDYTIINMNVGEYTEEVIDNYTPILQYRFNLKPNAWVMSNIIIDFSDADFGSTVRYFSCSDTVVNEAINKSTNHFVNINNKNDLDLLYSDIIENLSRN